MSVEGWKEVKLGDIANIIMGQSPKGTDCNMEKIGLPLLNGPTEFTDRFPVPVQYTINAPKTASKGSILFCVRGSTTGRMNWADKEYAIGRGIASISSKTVGTNQFIKAVLELNLDLLLSIATGSTFPNVSKPMLHELKIFLPTLSEQQAIAATLSALDDAIELNNQINKKLEEMAQAIFKSWFVDFEPFKDGEFEESELGLIPKGWRVGCLGEICDINMGQSPSSETYNSVGVGMPFYQGVKDFGFKYPKVSTYCSKPKKVANSFDILFSVRAPVGEINFAYEKCCIGRGVSALRLKHHKNNILYYWLKTITKQFHDASNGSIFDAINKSGIERVKVIIPNDENVIDKFNEFIEPMDMELFNNFVSTKVLTSLRDTLLPKLISGEIRVPVEEVEQLV